MFVVYLFLKAVQFLPALVCGVAVSASVYLKSPLDNYIGVLGCKTLITLNYASILSLNLGGTCNAMYRMIIYRFTCRISQCKTIRNVILLVELILFLGLFGYSQVIRSITKGAPFYDFCLGHDFELSEIIPLYEGTSRETLALAKTLKMIRLVFVIMTICVELLCHMILHYWKYQDNRIERNRNLKRKRNQLNAITLSGQSVSLAVEIVYTILHWQFTVMNASGWNFMNYLPVYGTIGWTLVTWSQIFASTDMRKCLFELLFKY